MFKAVERQSTRVDWFRGIKKAEKVLHQKTAVILEAYLYLQTN